MCLIYTLLSFRQSKGDLKAYKVTWFLRHWTNETEDRQKTKWESVPFTSEPTNIQISWFTSTSPFFQLIPWNHSKTQTSDTVPSESGLPADVYSYFIQLCRGQFYNFSAENNVCSDEDRSLLCFPKDVCPAQQTAGKAELSSQSAPAEGSLNHQQWFIDFCSIVSLWCYNCELT